MKTYKLELVLVESTDEKEIKILRREQLGSYPTEREAHEILELVELPDPKHGTVV